MSKDIKQILEPYFLKLPELRGVPSLWAEFKCLPETGSDGTSVDAGHQQRTNLLVSLFYDQRTSDENLLRYLLRQEIEMHHQIQGVRKSLEINIGLLARFRSTNNIELLMEAKDANADTRSSLNPVSFISPGVEKSYCQLPNLSEHHRNIFVETLGPAPEECKFTDDEAAQWINDQAVLLPASLDSLQIEDEIYLADILGQHAILDSKIADWIVGRQKWDKDSCHTLHGYEIMRGNIPGQIEALKKIGDYEPDKTEGKQLNFFQLAGLYIEIKDFDAAHKNICFSLNNYPSESMTWETCRMYAERFLDIILGSRNGLDPSCIDSFKWIKTYLDYQPWTDNWDVKIIPRIMTACVIIGDSASMKKFSDLFRIRKKEQFDRMKG